MSFVPRSGNTILIILSSLQVTTPYQARTFTVFSVSHFIDVEFARSRRAEISEAGVTAKHRFLLGRERRRRRRRIEGKARCGMGVKLGCGVRRGRGGAGRDKPKRILLKSCQPVLVQSIT